MEYNHQGGIYQTSLSNDTTTTFPLAFKNKCLAVIKNAYGSSSISSHNVLFKEWGVINVSKSSFVTKSTDPATSMVFISIGF